MHARNTGRSVVIAIADTGIGIRARGAGEIGRPFEQVENHFTKSHQGSGLGLAISKSLVELHGGTHAHPLDAEQGNHRLAAPPDQGARAGPDRLQVAFVGASSHDGEEHAASLISLALAAFLAGGSRLSAEDADEAPAHALLRLDEMRFERRDVGHVGGAGEQAEKAAPAVSGSNGPVRHSRRIWVRS